MATPSRPRTTCPQCRRTTTARKDGTPTAHYPPAGRTDVPTTPAGRCQGGQGRRQPTKSGEWMTVNEILEDLGISRRTWQRWREMGRAPKCKRTPGRRELRIRRSDYDAWLESLEDA